MFVNKDFLRRVIMSTLPNTHLTAKPGTPLVGRVTVPGDKSVSHRSLMLGAMAVGETRVSGLLEGEDVLATAEAMKAMGAYVAKQEDGTWLVRGVGVGGLREPEGVLDFGNAGTGVRLCMGLMAGHPITATLNGDASLCRRPMGRVTTPLERMGASFAGREGDLLPMTMTGAGDVLPIEYELPVPSAQVKSAVLLAGLNAAGETSVIEPEPTRDHTENMLRHFGADVRVENRNNGSRKVTLVGQPELVASDIQVPADISSAAFLLVAGLIVPGSQVTVQDVGLNPLRAGILTCLQEMGGDLTIADQRIEAGEAIGTITVKASKLRGIDVPAVRAPSMIDEYPVLAIAASFAEGETRMNGLAELRVKESDRLSAIANGLRACGVDLEEGEDWLVVRGRGVAPQGGGTISVDLDHRIAMSFLVMGLASKEPVTINDGTAMDTSFPGFKDLMKGLGGDIA